MLIPGLILVGLFFAQAGVLVGVRAEQFDDVALYQTFVLQPLIFLGGVFYGASLLPQPWQTLTRFNPVYYMIALVRYGFIGYHDTSILLAFVFLVVVHRRAVRAQLPDLRPGALPAQLSRSRAAASRAAFVRWPAVTRAISVNAVYEALGRFVVRFRWAVVVFWLAVAVVTSGALPSIGSEVNDNNSAFLKNSEPSIHAANVAAPILGGGASGNVTQIPLVAVSDSGRLNAADVASITKLAGLLKRVSRVESVQVAGVSPDVQAVQLRLRAHISVSATPDKDKTLVDALQAQFPKADPPTGLHFYVTGQIATIVANQQQSDKQGGQVQSVSFIFIIVLLLIVFRSLPAALITLLPAGLALAISGRLIGALGQGGLKVSSITQILLIVLLLGAGTDYGLFYVFRVREELRDGHDPHQAVERALVRVGESITGSAGTVIIALLTLLFASFGLYHDLGVPLAIGMAVMLLIGLTLLPGAARDPRSQGVLADEDPRRRAAGGDLGQGRLDARAAPEDDAGRRRARVPGAGRRRARLQGRRLRRRHQPAQGHPPPQPATPRCSSTSRTTPRTRPTSSSPTASSVWQSPQRIAQAEAVAAALGQLQAARRAAQPQRHGLSGAAAHRALQKLGPPQSCRCAQPASAKVPPRGLQRLPRRRAVRVQRTAR